jgi:hypothetical protein
MQAMQAQAAREASAEAQEAAFGEPMRVGLARQSSLDWRQQLTEALESGPTTPLPLGTIMPMALDLSMALDYFGQPAAPAASESVDASFASAGDGEDLSEPDRPPLLADALADSRASPWEEPEEAAVEPAVWYYDGTSVTDGAGNVQYQALLRQTQGQPSEVVASLPANARVRVTVHTPLQPKADHFQAPIADGDADLK